MSSIPQESRRRRLSKVLKAEVIFKLGELVIVIHFFSDFIKEVLHHHG